MRHLGAVVRRLRSVKTCSFGAILVLLLTLVLTLPGAAVSGATSVGCCDRVGDVDHNGAISSADLIKLVAYIFKGGAVPYCRAEADANSDGLLNAADLVFLVAYVFRGGAAPDECRPLIFIQHLQPGDNTVSGLAYVPDTTNYRVVLWAKTDRWYVQPFATDPYTAIRSDGSWSNLTHPWERISALLVDSEYVPSAIREQHPSEGVGVVEWDEYPERSADTYIDWSGYRWRVKEAKLTGPGPNAFSSDSANVSVDQDDQLHLKIEQRDSTWYCAEIILDHSLGYGVYTFRLDSRVDSLNYNTIFAGFIYDSTAQEFDMEFSRILADPHNAQYVIQPWYIPGHIEYFDMPDTSQTSHSFEWRSDRIVFKSWRGHADSSSAATLIHAWTYAGEDIPTPGSDRMRFNLYLAGGDPPSGGSTDEVTVTTFRFAE